MRKNKRWTDLEPGDIFVHEGREYMVIGGPQPSAFEPHKQSFDVQEAHREMRLAMRADDELIVQVVS